MQDAKINSRFAIWRKKLCKSIQFYWFICCCMFESHVWSPSLSCWRTDITWSPTLSCWRLGLNTATPTGPLPAAYVSIVNRASVFTHTPVGSKPEWNDMQRNKHPHASDCTKSSPVFGQALDLSAAIGASYSAPRFYTTSRIVCLWEALVLAHECGERIQSLIKQVAMEPPPPNSHQTCTKPQYTAGRLQSPACKKCISHDSRDKELRTHRALTYALRLTSRVFNKNQNIPFTSGKSFHCKVGGPSNTVTTGFKTWNAKPRSQRINGHHQHAGKLGRLRDRGG